ncbi:MAG: MFS transporter [Actinobacteria bacterium]|nr:MFS transporter [Actinomycetota bacterium]
MPARRGLIPAMMIIAMVMSTFSLFAMAVLASAMIDDLEISRATLGLVGALNTGLGALTAPATGRLADVIGPRRAVLGTMAFGTVGMLVMGVASNIWLVALALLIAGIAQGWGNPACNAYIAAAVSPGEQGMTMGLKQSGVTLAIVISGLALPPLENASTWQGACLVAGLVFVGLSLVATRLLPRLDDQRRPDGPGASTANKSPLPPFIRRLAIYALLMGMASGAIGRFLPLFLEEELSVSALWAGRTVAASGLIGMVARITAAHMAERGRPTRMLAQLALMGACSSVMLALSTTVGVWVIAPMVLLYGVGYTAWNAVINLAIVISMPSEDAGRASGPVIFGFLGGVTVVSPLAGWIVDTWGTYGPVWWGGVVLALASVLLVYRLPMPRSEAS